MTQITVTEYQTTETEVQKYECDHCGVVVEANEINTVGYVQGDPRETARFSDRSVERKHLCEGCIGLRKALEIRERKDYYRTWWNETRRKIAWLAFIVPAFMLGVAYRILLAHGSAETLAGKVLGSTIVFFFLLVTGSFGLVWLYELLTGQTTD
jgi:hypothetical protein